MYDSYSSVENKIFGVVGLGKSGRATVASLLASGARVLAWDDAEKSRAAVAVEFPAVQLLPVAEWEFSGMASLVMSPGILLSHPAVRAAQKVGVEVIGDIELLYRAQPHATYIGITGTNGKSTTTSLIAHVLAACGKRVEMGGNIGVPALALAPLGAGDMYVLELSSYQLDLVTSTRFQTAILLNITPDHLDHHGGMEEYIAAKMHVFDRQQPGDYAIVGIDDAVSDAACRTLIGRKKAQTIPLSVIQPVAHGVEVENATLRTRFGAVEQEGNLAGIRSLQGQHNWQNAAAAYTACVVNGCTHEAVMAALASYPGLPHRMQWLGEIGGVQFVNDSKATNADAAEKALKTYDNIHWIVGGVAKEGGIATLTAYFHKIQHAYLIGEATELFAKTLEGHVPYTRCETLDAAFAQASHIALHMAATTLSGQLTKPVVLLAPACASFDQFANFEVRGEAFAALYDRLRKERAA